MINNTTDLTFKEKNIKTQFFCALFIDIIGILLKKFLIQVKYLSNQIHIKI